MEAFDVYNKDRKKLGYTKNRGESLNNSEYSIGVEVWLFYDNKLLLTKRSLKKSHPGKWEVPGGCGVKGENSVDTLIREIKEEVGINLNNSCCNLLDTIIYKQQFVDIYKYDLKSLPKIKLQYDEVIDILFVSKDEFLSMVHDSIVVESVVNRYLIIQDKLNWL